MIHTIQHEKMYTVHGKTLNIEPEGENFRGFHGKMFAVNASGIVYT